MRHVKHVELIFWYLAPPPPPPHELPLPPPKGIEQNHPRVLLSKKYRQTNKHAARQTEGRTDSTFRFYLYDVLKSQII